MPGSGGTSGLRCAPRSKPREDALPVSRPAPVRARPSHGPDSSDGRRARPAACRRLQKNADQPGAGVEATSSVPYRVKRVRSSSAGRKLMPGSSCPSTAGFGRSARNAHVQDVCGKCCRNVRSPVPAQCHRRYQAAASGLIVVRAHDLKRRWYRKPARNHGQHPAEAELCCGMLRRSSGRWW